MLPILESCDNCGACCMNVGTPPLWRYDEELARMPAELAAEVLAAHDTNPMGEGPCIWLDLKTRRCRHYEYRPDACRDFELSSIDCHQIRTELGIVADR